LASVIGITNGILYSYFTYNTFDPFDAFLTYLGVIFLHASVDILNDYWDYKRGIDTITKRTAFSGGTGVLPDNKLKPNSVYKAGISCLLIGLVIGIYFVLQDGILVAVILAVAVVSIYFYSTTIVNIGLGETFVAVKGSLIVIGSAYVQSGIIDNSVIFLGIIIGLLSSVVILIASIPDYTADKSKGRRTLIIMVGKDKGMILFQIIIVSIYSLLSIGIILEYLPFYSIITFISLPFAIKSIKLLLKDYENIDYVVVAVSNTIKFSRIIGIGLFISYGLAILIKL